MSINVYECPECGTRIEVKHNDPMVPTVHCLDDGTKTAGSGPTGQQVTFQVVEEE